MKIAVYMPTQTRTSFYTCNRACKLFNIRLYATLCFNYFWWHCCMFSYGSVFDLQSTAMDSPAPLHSSYWADMSTWWWHATVLMCLYWDATVCHDWHNTDTWCAATLLGWSQASMAYTLRLSQVLDTTGHLTGPHTDTDTHSHSGIASHSHSVSDAVTVSATLGVECWHWESQVETVWQCQWRLVLSVTGRMLALGKPSRNSSTSDIASVGVKSIHCMSDNDRR